MLKLDETEVGYVRVEAQAKLYDGSMVTCTVYGGGKNSAIDRDRSKDKPPTARYIDVMIEGAKHFGVSKEYIEKL